MCLAVPGKLIAISGEDPLTRTGKVEFSGLIKEISLALLPEAAIGSYILVHAGFAITILDEVEASRSLEYLEGLGSIAGDREPQ